MPEQCKIPACIASAVSHLQQVASKTLPVDANSAWHSLNNDRSHVVQYDLKTRLNHQKWMPYPKICCQNDFRMERNGLGP